MLHRSMIGLRRRKDALRVRPPGLKQNGFAVGDRRCDGPAETGRLSMFRFAVRVFGLWCLAGGFAAAMIDGMKSIAASRVIMSTALETWSELAPGSLAAVVGFVEARLGPAMWASAKSALATVPTWALLGVVGAILVAVALPREDEVLPGP